MKASIQLLSNQRRDGHGPCFPCSSLIYIWRWNLDVWMCSEVFLHILAAQDPRRSWRAHGLGASPRALCFLWFVINLRQGCWSFLSLLRGRGIVLLSKRGL